MDRPAQHLILHGCVTLLVGLLCGIPFGVAITREADSAKINAWRVAHSALILGAVLMFAIASVMPMIGLTAFWAKLLTLSWVVSAYAFIVALPYGAVINERGLKNKPGRAFIVYFGNTIAAIGSIVGAAILFVSSVISVVIT